MIYTLFCSCRKTRPFRINRLGILCAGAKTSNPLFSVHYALFCKTGGVGTPALPRRASLPPSYAPRGASIPCTLTRLRILPVTTGVYESVWQLVRAAIYRVPVFCRPQYVGLSDHENSVATQTRVPLRELARCTEAQKCLSVTPLFATLTHSVSRLSFPCHSYANTRDGDTTVVSQSFFFSALQNQQLTTNNCKLLERGKREEAMGNVVYVSKSRLERKRGPVRVAHLPGEARPVIYSVHGAIAEHYKVDPANIGESHSSTIDYVISATAG